MRRVRQARVVSAAECSEATHRGFEPKSMSEGESRTCACGGVTVTLEKGEVRMTATVKALQDLLGPEPARQGYSLGFRP